MADSDDPRERFAAIRAELEKMDLPSTDAGEPLTELGTADEAEDPVEAKLRAMDEKVRAAASTRLPDLPVTPEIRRPVVDREVAADRAAARGLGNGLAVAYTLIGAPIVAIGLGYLLDNWLKTEFFKAIGAIGGGGLGIWLAVHLLNKQERQG